MVSVRHCEEISDVQILKLQLYSGEFLIFLSSVFRRTGNPVKFADGSDDNGPPIPIWVSLKKMD